MNVYNLAVFLCSAFLVSLLLPSMSIAENSDNSQKPVRYGLIVANNKAIDGKTKKLEFADDDGLLYRELFLPFFQRVELLTVADEMTQRLHPDVGSYTKVPNRKNLLETMASLNAEMESQKTRSTELMFVFVGHGGLDEEARGFINLSDGYFTRADFFYEIVKGSKADTTHIIIDACNSFSFVAGRGKDEQLSRELKWKQLSEFLAGNDLQNYPNVGVLTAMSESQESYEWSQIKSGIFSYEIRSALMGAADVNGDGLLEYSEVAAFIDAANSKIFGAANRTRVFAWPPRRNLQATLFDIRDGKKIRHVLLAPKLTGKFVIKNDHGERLAEFNKSNETVVAVVPSSKIYLQTKDKEVSIEPNMRTILIENMKSNKEIAARGIVNDSFIKQLFAIPFNASYYKGFISNQEQLLPVSMYPEEEKWSNKLMNKVLLKQESIAMPIMQIEGGYFIAPSLFDSRKAIENSVYFMAGLPIRKNWWATGKFEAGLTRLKFGPATEMNRFALTIGLRYQRPLNRYFVGFLGLEFGESAEILRKVNSNNRTIGPVARALAGLKIRIIERIGATLGMAGSGYFAKLDNSIRFSKRIELGGGLVWSFGE